MGILSWIVFGFVVGLIARAVMPGRQKMGFIMTTALGVGGSFVGGAIAHMLFHPVLHIWSSSPVDRVGFLGSVIGALVILLVGQLFTQGRTTRSM